jgi:ferric-dicitrate binding protein FerR (iron transport regulator)
LAEAIDRQRRFIVTTDLARIEGAGTEFSVSNTEQSIVVTVSEGVVEISPRGLGMSASGVPRTLRKDQRLILPKNGSASTIQKVAAHTERGWLDLPWRLK